MSIAIAWPAAALLFQCWGSVKLCRGTEVFFPIALCCSCCESHTLVLMCISTQFWLTAPSQCTSSVLATSCAEKTNCGRLRWFSQKKKCPLRIKFRYISLILIVSYEARNINTALWSSFFHFFFYFTFKSIFYKLLSHNLKHAYKPQRLPLHLCSCCYRDTDLNGIWSKAGRR